VPLDAQFHFAKLRATEGTRLPVLREQLEAGLVHRLNDAGITLWGAWAAIFGIAGNEVIIVTNAAPDLDLRGGVEAAVSAWDGVEIIDEHLMTPTIRPARTSRLATPEGIYVIRYFDLLRSDIDEFVRLSDQGWPSFEADEEFDFQPQGLFVREGESERTSMVLITWYESLASWQRSRQFPEDARKAFQQRGTFTLRSIAYATRLLQP
jgi:hypothetical protein